MRYQWSDDYLTGNAKIDDQHRLIFDAANLLYDAVRRKDEDSVLDQAFDLLLRYTNTHFQDEEAHYRQIGSSLLKTQEIEHRTLLNEIRDLWQEKRRGSDSAGSDLDHWMEKRLVPHIVAEDTRAQKSGKR